MYSIYFIIILFFWVVLSAVIILASKNGSKAAQLEALKAEIKKEREAQERANRINNFTANLSADDARRMLHDVANEQSKRVQ